MLGFTNSFLSIDQKIKIMLSDTILNIKFSFDDWTGAIKQQFYSYTPNDLLTHSTCVSLTKLTSLEDNSN